MLYDILYYMIYHIAMLHSGHIKYFDIKTYNSKCYIACISYLCLHNMLYSCLYSCQFVIHSAQQNFPIQNVKANMDSDSRLLFV